MAKGGKSSAVPKLRFPEFRGAPVWTEARLDDLITVIAPPAKLQSTSYLSSGRFPIVDQSQQAISGWTDDATAVVMEPLPLIVFGDHTCALKLLKQPFAQGADGIKILRAKAVVSSEYLFHSLGHRPLAMEDYKRHFSMLKDRPVSYPDIKTGEQQKIADCLSSLDEVIAAQGRKVEALKTYKRGLTQQLFPREGEKNPRLRLPGFRDGPEWIEKKLSVSIDLVSGMHLSPLEYSTTGDIPYFTGPSDFTNDARQVTKWTRASANTARVHDTLITVKGSGVGELWYLEMASVAMGRQLMAVRAKSCSSRFIFQLLLTKRTRFEDLAAGNLIPGLARGDILDLVALTPEEDEQNQIADCLTSLDVRIVVELEKLDELNTHKKGLMQQLFPTPKGA